MEHGLMVGAWMMAAALIGVWLWKVGVINQLWGIVIRWLVAALLVTTLLVKSAGALLLLAMGLVILFVAKWFRTSLLLLALIVVISSYLFVGVTGTFSSDPIVSVVSEVMDEERAQSLEFRFDNEKILSDKARQRMVFGWGGWGRSRVYDEWGKDISITDSLWIIAFGTNGVIGVISITASLLLPVIGFVQRYPAFLWHNRKVAPAAALAVLLVLYMVDCLLNALINPIYILTSGGIAGLALKQTRTSKVMGVPLSVAERYLVQQRQPGKSNRKES
jgi:O-antigen ligase